MVITGIFCRVEFSPSQSSRKIAVYNGLLDLFSAYLHPQAFIGCCGGAVPNFMLLRKRRPDLAVAM